LGTQHNQQISVPRMTPKREKTADFSVLIQSTLSIQ
jgi:hypothetical protein